jgi:hypothetical protein
MAEFQKWDSIPRLFKDCHVTEKIDGTNACVVIEHAWDAWTDDNVVDYVDIGDTSYLVYAQSRNRFITTKDDNAGFAQWVKENAAELVEFLGEGYHYGEWFGRGIQRGYGIFDKRFALFNAHRWGFLEDPMAASNIPGLVVVPTLYQGPFDTEVIKDYFSGLMGMGSEAVPGFMKPEGIIVFHSAAKQYFKMTDQGDKPKWQLESLTKAVGLAA